MTALFIPCYYDGLGRQTGSARIRAEWVCRYWDGAEVYDGSQRFGGYDLYVFQKAYLTKQTQAWIRTVAWWRNGGPCRLAFDLCDPDFLDAEHERRLLSVLPLFDFAVAPTQLLVDWLERWLPAYVIPDRVDLGEVRGRKRPTDTGKPSLVWFGYAHNAVTLKILLSPFIEHVGLPLTIVAERAPSVEWFERYEAVRFVPWARETVNDVILEHDIVLNPRLPEAPWCYKSDNKTVHVWALGMPVAQTVEDLTRFLDPQERASEGEARYREVREKWDVKLSVAQWQEIAFDESSRSVQR